MIKISSESYIGHIDNRYNADVVIGKYTSIARNFKIVIASHPSITHNTVSNFPFEERLGLNYPKCITGGKIVIGNDVWIGQNVTLVGELSIGDGAIIGYGAVVAKDVPSYAVVVGNPVKTIRYRFTEDQIKKLLEIKWWDWPVGKIKENMQDFLDINKFIKKHGYRKI